MSDRDHSQNKAQAGKTQYKTRQSLFGIFHYPILSAELASVCGNCWHLFYKK